MCGRRSLAANTSSLLDQPIISRIGAGRFNLFGRSVIITYYPWFLDCIVTYVLNFEGDT